MYDFTIEGQPVFSELTINLKPGDVIKAEAGALSYMDGSIEMETKSGGIFAAIKRMFSGESLFLNFFSGSGSITFGSHSAGDLIKLDLQSNVKWIVQKDGFLAGTPNLKISSKWGGIRSIFGGEGAFLTSVMAEEGAGIVFLAGYGSIKKHELAAGQEFVVDNGIFFATEETTKFKLSKIGGFKSFVLGGEGVVMRFIGPGTVYTQSRSGSDLLGLIRSLLPSGQSGSH